MNKTCVKDSKYQHSVDAEGKYTGRIKNGGVKKKSKIAVIAAAVYMQMEILIIHLVIASSLC